MKFEANTDIFHPVYTKRTRYAHSRPYSGSTRQYASRVLYFVFPSTLNTKIIYGSGNVVIGELHMAAADERKGEYTIYINLYSTFI